MSSNTTYTFRAGREKWAPSAQEIGETVERLIARDKVCTSEAFVREAEPETSPLHTLFEWDDAKAARQFRNWRARDAINSVQVVRMTKAGPQVVASRAFVSIAINRAAPGGQAARGYIRMVDAALDQDYRHELIAREWNEFRRLLERSAWIEEFAPLRAAFAAVELPTEEEELAIAAD